MAFTPVNITSAFTVEDGFQTTLSNSITASTTAIPLSTLPAGTEGTLVIEPGTANEEEIYYTSKGTGVVNVPSAADGRGINDTTAVAHNSGAIVKMLITKATIQSIQYGGALQDNAVVTRHLATNSVPYAKVSSFDKASVTRTSTQLIGNSSSTACSFTAAAFQRVAGDMWVVGDPTKITIRTTGIYLIAGNVSFATNSTGIRSAAILLNGSSIYPLAETLVSAASANTTNLSVVTILSLTAGNYITLNVYQTSGGNLDTANSRLSVTLLP